MTKDEELIKEESGGNSISGIEKVGGEEQSTARIQAVEGEQTTLPVQPTEGKKSTAGIQAVDGEQSTLATQPTERK